MQLNERSNRKGRKNQEGLKKFCPFVEDPYEDCYCFNIMNSQEVRRVVHYCGKDFEDCEIYKKILKGKNVMPKARYDGFMRE